MQELEDAINASSHIEQLRYCSIRLSKKEHLKSLKPSKKEKEPKNNKNAQEDSKEHNFIMNGNMNPQYTRLKKLIRSSVSKSLRYPKSQNKHYEAKKSLTEVDIEQKDNKIFRSKFKLQNSFEFLLKEKYQASQNQQKQKLAESIELKRKFNEKHRSNWLKAKIKHCKKPSNHFNEPMFLKIISRCHQHQPQQQIDQRHSEQKFEKNIIRSRKKENNRYSVNQEQKNQNFKSIEEVEKQIVNVSAESDREILNFNKLPRLRKAKSILPEQNKHKIQIFKPKKNTGLKQGKEDIKGWTINSFQL